MLTNKLSAARRVYTAVMRVLLLLAAVLTAALVVFMIVYVLYKGLPYVTWHLISTKPSYITGAIGILPDICNTMQILLASLLIVLPLGVGAAGYLTEYAQNKKLVAAIEYAAETLSGIPSIIYGLVGMLFFCEFLGMQTSLLAGALTLVIMNLPTVLRTTQESLRTVPQSYREGAFGLGAGKWRVVRTVVLPGCIDGIVTGCILSAGRILGESAALLFTAGFAHTLNKFVIGLASPGATLALMVALYAYAKEEGEFDVAFAIAAIRMILTLLINLAAGIVGKQIPETEPAMKSVNPCGLMRAALINDLSCFGKCSLSVAIPILSSYGVETVPLPTAILSTHTGGFTGFVVQNMTENMRLFAAHWKSSA